MVGQTLSVKVRPYRYYRCRHVYDRNTKGDCTARYVRADHLEASVWQEVIKVLSNPGVVLHELEHQWRKEIDTGEIERIEREIASLSEREKRVVRLFSYGEIDEAVIRDEGAALQRQRAMLEDRLTSVERPAELKFTAGDVDADALDRTCRAVAEWLGRVGDADRMLALEALQLAVVATKEAATIRGVLPVKPHEFITAEESCRCSSNGDNFGIPEPRIDHAQRLNVTASARSRVRHPGQTSNRSRLTREPPATFGGGCCIVLGAKAGLTRSPDPSAHPIERGVKDVASDAWGFIRHASLCG